MSDRWLLANAVGLIPHEDIVPLVKVIGNMTAFSVHLGLTFQKDYAMW